MPTYVVTGANRGIGLEHIRHLSAIKDNRIVAIVRRAGPHKSLEDLKASGPAELHIVQADNTKTSLVPKLAEAIASVLPPSTAIDVIINNAAILENRDMNSLNISDEALATHITTNVMGPAHVVQALEPLLSKGSVVANITSGMGSLGLLADEKILPNICAYSVSKAALNMLTIHQAYNLRDRGVVVVAVDPGHVKTEMGGEGAVLEPDFSSASLLKTISGLTMEQSGKFFLHDGKALPW